MTVPSDFVPLEPSRVQQLLGAAQAAEPNAEISLVAMRSPAGLRDGLVYVQRADMRWRPPAGPRTVRELLDLTAAEARRTLEASGVVVQDAQSRPRDGGLETCLRALMPSPEGDGMSLDACSFAYVGSGERLRFLVAHCSAAVGRGSCARISESRRFTADGALPLDTTLSSAAARGMPGVGLKTVGDVTFGMSRVEFQAMCREAGFEVDRFDWSNERPEVRSWASRGLVSQCSGVPGVLPLGTVVQANGIFTDGRLTFLSIYLRDPAEAVEAQLQAAYPETMQVSGRTIHLVRRQAIGDEIVSVALGAGRVPGSRSMVSFESRAGVDAPPLMPTPGVP